MDGVMTARLRRSRGVTETLTLAVPAAKARPTLDFDQLYRDSRDDVYVDYENGYYLYNRRDPGVALAITVVL